MVIDKLNVVRAIRFPHEADVPLVVHPDAVLAFTIALERFQTIARGRPQVLNVPRGVEHTLFTSHGRLEIVRESPNRLAAQDGLRRRALE